MNSISYNKKIDPILMKFKNSKTSDPHRLLRYLIDKINLNRSDKTINHLIRIYVNKIENRITFKIKIGYYLKVLRPETMKLLGSTKSKIKCTSFRN